MSDTESQRKIVPGISTTTSVWQTVLVCAGCHFVANILDPFNEIWIPRSRCEGCGKAILEASTRKNGRWKASRPYPAPEEYWTMLQQDAAYLVGARCLDPWSVFRPWTWGRQEFRWEIRAGDVAAIGRPKDIHGHVVVDPVGDALRSLAAKKNEWH